MRFSIAAVVSQGRVSQDEDAKVERESGSGRRAVGIRKGIETRVAVLANRGNGDGESNADGDGSSRGLSLAQRCRQDNREDCNEEDHSEARLGEEEEREGEGQERDRSGGSARSTRSSTAGGGSGSSSSYSSSSRITLEYFIRQNKV